MSLSQQPGCLGVFGRFLKIVLGEDSGAATDSWASGLPEFSEDSEAAEALPYRRKDFLFSKAERSFFGVLEHVAGDSYLLFAKVRLADLMWLPKGTEKRQSLLNRITAKHVDFVLCSRDTVRPLVAIELDDSSHQRQSRVQRDAFVDEALAAAGLPLVRVRAQAAYNVGEVRTQIERALGSGEAVGVA
jgi:hypothetical protein